MKKKTVTKSPRSFNVKAQAKEAWANYRNDIKAGHKDAIEYWHGAAVAYDTVANAQVKKTTSCKTKRKKK